MIKGSSRVWVKLDNPHLYHKALQTPPYWCQVLIHNIERESVRVRVYDNTGTLCMSNIEINLESEEFFYGNPFDTPPGV